MEKALTYGQMGKNILEIGPMEREMEKGLSHGQTGKNMLEIGRITSSVALELLFFQKAQSTIMN